MPASPSLRWRGSTPVTLIVLFATQASLLLRWLVPVNPVSLSLAAFDGGLFERLSASVANHDWLGPLTVTTLAKGPGYPLFMAVMKRIGLPLPVGEQAVYLVGAGGIAVCVWLVTKRPLMAAVVYAVLAFEPSNFGLLGSQVTRENLYTGLTLVFLSGVFITIYGALQRVRLELVLLAGLLAGLAGAAFWLCREEGVWLAPALGLIGAGLFLRWWLADGWDWRVIGRVAVAGVVLAVAFAAPVALVHKKNKDTYGVAITTDLASGTFPEAYAAMSRVRGVPLTPFVPFNAAQRAAVYRVSPTARLLQPRLEDPTNGWRAYDCGDAPCNDYAGSIAAWALRDAAHAAGKFDDEPTMQRFFGAIAKEVTKACDGGGLQCSRKLPTSMQSFDRARAGDVLTNALHALVDLPLHANVTYLPNEATVNQVEAADRPTINAGIAHAPRDQAEALQAARTFESRAAVFRVIRAVYGVGFIAALLVGLLGLAITARNKRIRTTWLPLQVLVVAMLGSIAVRLVMFAIIDTSQYDVEIRYHLVTRALLFTSAVLAVLPAVAAIWPKLTVKETIIN